MADKKTIVEVARSRWQRAKDLTGTLRQQAIEDTRFVMGDSDNQWQWPEDVYTNRAAVSGKPCLTINVTAQHCNQIINTIRQNKPAAKISPVDGLADRKTAQILGGMLRSIQSYSNADTAHDIGAEHAIYGGEGYWRVLTEYESDSSFDQVITIRPLVNPQLVYIDPDSIEPDRSDAKWGMIFEDMSKDQFREDYPDLDASSWVEDPMGWNSKDMVRRAEYFWCESKPDMLVKLVDGSVMLKSEMPAGADLVVVAERPTTKKIWYWCKLVGGETEPVDKQVWPGSYLPIITVVGKELNVNGDIVRKGVVRDLKDSARMVNYSYSAAVETLALQNKVPYLASAESIAGFEDIWGAANIENRAYLPYNERDMEGNQLAMPQRQAPAQMASAQVQMLQLSTEQMRASSGQQNANFGIRSDAQSGIGIQRLKVQGEIATFHFPDNLARALKYEAKVIIDLIPKLYDTRRVVRILGLDGKEQAALLDPEMPTPHEDLDGDIKEAFNPNVGRYDVAIDTGPSFQTQRQESADALTTLSQANPQIMQVAGDIVMRAYDFPLADELSERLARALPPGLIESEGNKKIPPEVQQALQQMGQQMDALTQELHETADALEMKEQEINAEKLKTQQAQSKTLSLQIKLETQQALKQIEDAQEQDEEQGNSGQGLEVAKAAAADDRERMKIEMQQDTTLKTEAMKIAGQIEIARISAQASATAPVTEDTGNESSAIIERLMQTHEALLQHIATPKQSQVRIVRQADGSFVGEKVES